MAEETLKPLSFFTEKYEISLSSLEEITGDYLTKNIDYSDIYFEYTIHESISLEEGLVKTASRNISQGVGVRAICGEKTGYAYSEDISIEQIRLASKAASYIASQGGESRKVHLEIIRNPSLNLYPLKTPPVDISPEEKIKLLEEIDKTGRAFDSRIKNVLASFSSEYRIILIVNSEGVVTGDIQPLCRLSITCIAEEGGNRQIGSYGGGGRVEFSYLLENDRFIEFTRKAAQQALINLEAIDAPAGMMDVVLGPGWPGILLHEAVGHGLEADFNRKRTSAFTDRIGEKVASELCTVIDDGTIPYRRGSINIDDEGTESHRTILIEKGILKGYLQDRLNARLMGMPLTGNGRRESYAHIPIPRMTNIFMPGGDATKEDIIRSVKKGLYAVAFGGGQVDITNGKFVFTTSEAYLIEDGRITAPVRGATLIGNGPEILTRVTMVGNDLELDAGVGTCGKDGQSVPVGVGLPTIKIEGITVGGTGKV